MVDCTIPITLLLQNLKDIFAGVYIALSLFGTVGIVVSMVCLSRLEQTVSNSNNILKSLIASDILVSVVGIPLMATKLLNYVNTDCTYECITSYLIMVGSATSSVTVLLLAFDRYMFVARRNKYEALMTRKRVFITIISTWCFILVMLSTRCYKSSISFIIMLIINSATMVGLVTFYLLVLRFMKRAKRERSQHTTLQQTSSNSSSDLAMKKKISSEHHVTGKVIIIIVCYFVTYIPGILVGIPYMLGYLSSYDVLLQIAFMLAVSNSCMNPIIYFCTDRRIRHEFWKLLSIRPSDVEGEDNIARDIEEESRV